MGKKSKKYPEYSGGSVVINGRTVAESKKNGNTISTNYNMSDDEKNIYNSIQSGLNTSIGNLFNITDNQRKEWTSQIDAMKNQGIRQINDIYNPMENNLKNDIAKRFGNLDNSVFIDSLNNITDKRSSAAAELNDNLLSKQNELYTKELQNRINTITLLNNLNSIMNDNIQNYINMANTNANAGNNYNNNSYNATVNKKSSYMSGVSQVASLASGMLSFL